MTGGLGETGSVGGDNICVTGGLGETGIIGGLGETGSACGGGCVY